MNRLNQKELASNAQMDYIIKLKSTTGNRESIPIPLYKHVAAKMIQDLLAEKQVLKENNRRDWDYLYSDAGNESSWGNYMWGCG
jgi:hypothetical protein